MHITPSTSPPLTFLIHLSPSSSSSSSSLPKCQPRGFLLSPAAGLTSGDLSRLLSRLKPVLKTPSAP
ncbi:hypothetical protein E2C01_042375 [Portunus trituberculatus]|uniref:Uncharacterized protein n=1 Tax=Portunus trituberculatus TaxID=210409 RepID=A0A5B7FUM2_PORTR|nr:hypothetical protein [Portunus trituberculatus]